MAEFVPYIQLGFAAVMAIILLALVRGYMEGLMAQNRDLINKNTTSQEKIVTTLDNHLSAIAINQALTKDALEKIEGRLLDAILLPVRGSKVNIQAETPADDGSRQS